MLDGFVRITATLHKYGRHVGMASVSEAAAKTLPPMYVFSWSPPFVVQGRKHLHNANKAQGRDVAEIITQIEQWAEEDRGR